MQLHPKKIDLSLGRVERLLAALGNPEERAAAGHPRCRHQRQGVHRRDLARLPRSRGPARACLHFAASGALSRAHPAGRRTDRRRRAARRVRRMRAGQRRRPDHLFRDHHRRRLSRLRRTPADIVLFETGLGGRLDATNVIHRPAVTAITPISLDHQVFLGDTVAAIAGEKAGILKPGVPAVDRPAAGRRRRGHRSARRRSRAPLYRWNREWRCEPADRGMGYEGGRWRLDLPLPSLAGAHQIANAGIALACLEQLSGFDLPAAALAAGCGRSNGRPGCSA